MWRKIFRRTLAALLIVSCMLTAAVVHAEVKTYTGVGEYYMSDFETPNVAQQRAKQRAEQNACEQAGVFVKSFSRTKNFELVEDEIITMTSGILKIIDVQFKRENFDNNTTLIRATIKAQIDSEDVLKWLNKSDDEKSTLERQYAEIRKAYAEQEKQIAELKKQLADVKTPQDEERITQQFADEDKIFLSNQKVEEGLKLRINRNYEEAIKLFNEAISLNPNNATAYMERGFIYEYAMEQYERAILDYTKAIELRPNDYEGYHYRGRLCMDSALWMLERNELLTAADYDKAIGFCERAIADFTKIIVLTERAIENFTKAVGHAPNNHEIIVNINPGYQSAYEKRGLSYDNLVEIYERLEDHKKSRNAQKKAQSDHDKAKELDVWSEN